MARFIGAIIVALLVSGLGRPARADDAQAIIDKAVKALGGEEKLSKVKAATWKGKGTITFDGNDNRISTQTTVRGIDHYRQEFEGDFGGNTIKGVAVLAGDKGWRRFGDDRSALEQEVLANQKRVAYLTAIPLTVLPLKGQGFKVEAAGEEAVDGKPAAGLRVTPPDGKEFRIYFDRESGLPVRLVAKVLGFMGEEYTQETNFGDYKEMGGIRKATKIRAKRDGERYIDQEITEFKVLDTVDPKTFAEPQ